MSEMTSPFTEVFCPDGRMESPEKSPGSPLFPDKRPGKTG